MMPWMQETIHQRRASGVLIYDFGFTISAVVDRLVGVDLSPAMIAQADAKTL